MPQEVPFQDPTLSDSPHRMLNVLVVDPDPARRNALKEQLRTIRIVKMAGVRSTANFLIDMVSENALDVIVLDEELGWETILEAVREVRIHPDADEIGFVVIGDQLGPEVRRRGSQVGILGYLQRGFGAGSLQEAMRESLGEMSEHVKHLTQAMRQAPFFTGFSDRELVRLLNMCRTRSYGDEEYVFEEGQPGHSLFILLSGSIDIQRRQKGKATRLATLQVGETFGEMAILDDAPRSADAVVKGEATVAPFRLAPSRLAPSRLAHLSLANFRLAPSM